MKFLLVVVALTYVAHAACSQDDLNKMTTCATDCAKETDACKAAECSFQCAKTCWADLDKTVQDTYVSACQSVKDTVCKDISCEMTGSSVASIAVVAVFALVALVF